MSGPGTSGADVVVAIDVGGTVTKCALVGAGDHAVKHAERHPTGASDGTDAVVARLLSLAEGLTDRARGLGLTPRAVGLVVPGIVDEARGMAAYAANLGWLDLPLRDLAAQRTGLPTVLGHDVRAGGLAEARLGAGRGVAQLLFVPIGTGIAGAHVVAGHPASGAHGAACELGHVVVRPSGRPCGCGRRGCLEAEASARAVADRYAELTAAAEPGAAAAARAGA
ncbi:MAG: ROK family protein, partial [Micromonosporaceae bacterium]